MLQSPTQLKKIYADLNRIFGTSVVDKVFSHIHSLSRKIEDLEESRNRWRKEALKERRLKFKTKSKEVKNGKRI